MKLGTIDNGTRDGQLVLVNKNLTKAVKVPTIVATMQQAMDNWEKCESLLRVAAGQLEEGKIDGIFDFTDAKIMAPIPRAYHWADGSAYVTHVELVRKARNAALPESFWTDPLMYMGASDAFIGANDDIKVENEDWGIDLEAEVVVITDDVPPGVNAEQAKKHIKLIGLVNDVSLRNLIPDELKKQFGFYQSKPWTSFSPVVVTPDELGDNWDGGKVHLPLHSFINGVKIGSPNAGIDMTFDFGQLIKHAAKTRSLMAGTIIGSGTVANKGAAAGSSCIAEIRCLEMIEKGEITTPFLKFGDMVAIEMNDNEGKSIFGKINQKIIKYNPVQ